MGIIGSVDDLDIGSIQLTRTTREHAVESGIVEIGPHIDALEIGIGVILIAQTRIERIGGSVAQRKHHPVITEVEILELDVDPRTFHGPEVELESRVERTAELELDGGGAVVDVERLVDIALCIAGNDLALDITAGDVLAETDVGEIGLDGRRGSPELDGFGISPTIVGPGVLQRTELVDENVLHLLDGNGFEPERRHVLVGPDLGGSGRIEIVVTPRAQDAEHRDEK